MDILLYLTELIKSRKEVGIPGLGTFYKRKSPGRYDTKKSSFVPPSYVLDFTTEVKEHVLLSDYISKKANIGTDNAVFQVDQFAQEITRKLENGEIASFGELGILSKSPNGLVFSPQPNSSIDSNFYGMPDLAEVSPRSEDQLSDLTETDAIDVQEEKSTLDDQPVYEEIAELRIAEKIVPAISIETPEGMENSEPEYPVQEEEKIVENVWKFEQAVPATAPETISVFENIDEEPTGMPIYLKIIIAGTIVFAAIIALYFLKPELFEKYTNGNNITEKPAPPIVSDSIPNDSTAYADSVAKAGLVPADAAIDTLKDTVATQPIDTAISYEIIAASLLNQKEADNFLRQMERKGIPAKVANMPGRRVKISIGTFTDEEEAKEQLQLLKKTTKIPGIYIYTNRHTNNNK